MPIIVVGVMLKARRLCRLRRETAFSSESTAGYSEGRFNGSPFFGEAQIVGGLLELATDCRLGRRRAGFPRHRASPLLD